jgi:hypothetical protein
MFVDVIEAERVNVLSGDDKSYLRNANFVILRYIFLNDYKLYSHGIWYTCRYGFPVSTDSFHSNTLVNRVVIIYFLIFSTFSIETYLIIL